MKTYDLIIIGGGPAGLSAAIYAARARMKTLILERIKVGGQIVITDEVANYPGSVQHATGPSLIARMEEQVESFGAERKKDNIKKKIIQIEKRSWIVSAPFSFIGTINL